VAAGSLQTVKEKEKPEIKKEQKPIPPVTQLFVKGNRFELDLVEKLGILLVPSRKEVKNTKVVKNFVHSYEDRFICLIDFNQNQPGKPSDIRIVVLKKYTIYAKDTRMKLSKAAFSLYSSTKS